MLRAPGRTPDTLGAQESVTPDALVTGSPCMDWVESRSCNGPSSRMSSAFLAVVVGPNLLRIRSASTPSGVCTVAARPRGEPGSGPRPGGHDRNRGSTVLSMRYVVEQHF